MSRTDGGRFDALAAAAETSDLDALPSMLVDEDADDEPATDDFITAHDLAHLTGSGGPSANGWDSPAPAAPSAEEAVDSGIDAPVSKAIIIPLVAFALAAVGFVAYSILTASPTIRPDAVALIDAPTTTLATTTTSELEATTAGVVGVDLAEQAAWLCSGDQFSIARAQAPSLAVYNDLLTATRDGRGDWEAPADHVTLRDPVPALIGCLTTADGGEIDRCPADDVTISRRSIMWSYRVLQSIDGTELGADSGTASEVRPCDELVSEADGDDMASWSALPQDRLDLVAAAFTSAPHPQIACTPTSSEQSNDTTPTIPAQGLSLHATFDNITDVDVPLPEGWMATEERPVEAVLCLSSTASDRPTATTSDDAVDDVAEGAAACDTNLIVNAVSRDGQPLGSWSYATSECPTEGETLTPPDDWWISVVGPSLGHELESGGE